MDWERERKNDERFAAWMLVVAMVLIAAGIVFQPVVYPAIGAALQWLAKL